MCVKKVVYISTASNISGATLALMEIVDQIKERGIEPIVITASRGPLEDRLKSRGIKLHKALYFSWLVRENELDSLMGKIKWKIKEILWRYSERKIKKVLKAEKPDIVHINTGISPVGLESAKELGIPVVWHMRELPVVMFNRIPFDEQYEIKCLRAADSVLAISKYVYNEYRDKTPENIKVVYDGVMTNGFSKLRNTELFSKEKIRFTLCGYNEFKGHEEAVRALSEVVTKGFTNVELCFWGEMSEDYEKHLNEVVLQLNLEKYVLFCGHTSTMEQEWANSDVALMCSKGECFGRVTVEAMAAGAVVIGSNVGATPEILGENRGVLYQKGNICDLAEKIIWVLNNQTDAKKIAKTGQLYIEQGVFSVEKNVDELLTVYHTLKNN